MSKINISKHIKDNFFPPNDSSLYRFKKISPDIDIVWKRPHEITDNPQFIVGDIVPNDLDQGTIGDWLDNNIITTKYYK